MRLISFLLSVTLASVVDKEFSDKLKLEVLNGLGPILSHGFKKELKALESLSLFGVDVDVSSTSFYELTNHLMHVITVSSKVKEMQKRLEAKLEDKLVDAKRSPSMIPFNRAIFFYEDERKQSIEQIVKLMDKNYPFTAPQIQSGVIENQVEKLRPDSPFHLYQENLRSGRELLEVKISEGDIGSMSSLPDFPVELPKVGELKAFIQSLSHGSTKLGSNEDLLNAVALLDDKSIFLLALKSGKWKEWKEIADHRSLGQSQGFIEIDEKGTIVLSSDGEGYDRLPFLAFLIRGIELYSPVFEVNKNIFSLDVFQLKYLLSPFINAAKKEIQMDYLVEAFNFPRNLKEWFTNRKLWPLKRMISSLKKMVATLDST